MPYHVLENNDNVFRIFMSAVYALCNERHRLFDCSGTNRRAGTVGSQDLDNGQLSTIWSIFESRAAFNSSSTLSVPVIDMARNKSASSEALLR